MTTNNLPEGFTLRAPVLDDADAVAEVMNAVEIDITGVPETSGGRVRWQWDRPGVDPERDLRVVTDPGGRIVGYLEYEGDEPWDQLRADGYVHPQRCGLGIGSALLDWAEQRAAPDAARAPDGGRVVLRHFLWANDERGRAFLENRSWEVCRWFYWMVIELDAPVPEPEPIQGIEIRTMRQGEERAVWAADDDAFREHWGYAPEPYEDWLHRHMSRDDFDPSLVFLAMDGDEIAGCVLNQPTREEDPDKGWVEFLGVRASWRRRGIARSLLETSFRALRERGRLRAGLGVDAENPTGAVALYEKVGMRVDREAVSYEKRLL